LPAHDYQVVPATLDHVAAMAPHVRQADIDEVHAASGLPIEIALEKSYRMSTHCWAGIVDGEVACIFGVSPVNMLAGKGSPWLLGTDLVERHAMAFLRRNRRYILIMLRMYNHLENYVDVRNTASIAWLKWLGFEFYEPEPYGKHRMKFMRFEMRA